MGFRFLVWCLFLLTYTDSFVIAIGIMTSGQVQRRIAQLQEQLLALGPLHPGSISEQYNVCGTPGCRCKDAHDPQKHGPYYQLSFTWRGKSSTRFVRPEQVQEMRAKVANYKRLRELVNEWVELAVELERAQRKQAKHAYGD
jgi:Family of unknown function (DUF6788)